MRRDVDLSADIGWPSELLQRFFISRHIERFLFFQLKEPNNSVLMLIRFWRVIAGINLDEKFGQWRIKIREFKKLADTGVANYFPLLKREIKA